MATAVDRVDAEAKTLREDRPVGGTTTTDDGKTAVESTTAATATTTTTTTTTHASTLAGASASAGASTTSSAMEEGANATRPLRNFAVPVTTPVASPTEEDATPPPSVTPATTTAEPLRTANVPVARVVGEHTVLRGDGAVYRRGRSPETEALRRTHTRDGGLGVLFIRLGSLDVRGDYVVPRTIAVTTILHGAKLDLSRATFVHPRTHISVVTILGGVKIILPSNVEARVAGVAVLGGFERRDEDDKEARRARRRGQPVPPAPQRPDVDAPVVVVNGVSVLGGCLVTVVMDVPRLIVVED